MSGIFDFLWKWFTRKDITLITTTTTSTIIPRVDGLKLSLHCGINKYPNPSNNLRGCVNDAMDMVSLFQNVYKFNECKMLTDNNATLDNVTNSVIEMLARIPDVFVFTNSSHGTRILDSTGEEADGYCEALCLYDRKLVDKNFRKILASADPRTHIIVVSDSCHSAGVTREFLATMNLATMNDASYVSIPKYLPPEDLMEALAVSMLPIKKAVFEPNEKMNEVLLAGCQSNQFSYDTAFDGRPNGAFTYCLNRILKDNPYITYAEFISKMHQHLPNARFPQTPTLECSQSMSNSIVFS